MLRRDQLPPSAWMFAAARQSISPPGMDSILNHEFQHNLPSSHNHSSKPHVPLQSTNHPGKRSQYFATLSRESCTKTFASIILIAAANTPEFIPTKKLQPLTPHACTNQTSRRVLPSDLPSNSEYLWHKKLQTTCRLLTWMAQPKNRSLSDITWYKSTTHNCGVSPSM